MSTKPKLSALPQQVPSESRTDESGPALPLATTGEPISPAEPNGERASKVVDRDDYAERLHALVIEAQEADRVLDLINALTWTLARIVSHFGKLWCAADIVRRFGNALCEIEDRRVAMAEAQAAKEAGQPVH